MSKLLNVYEKVADTILTLYLTHPECDQQFVDTSKSLLIFLKHFELVPTKKFRVKSAIPDEEFEVKRKKNAPMTLPSTSSEETEYENLSQRLSQVIDLTATQEEGCQEIQDSKNASNDADEAHENQLDEGGHETSNGVLNSQELKKLLENVDFDDDWAL